jgi:hypothetical protein
MTGFANTAIGFSAAQGLDSGSHNAFVGTNAGVSVTTGSRNIAIGSNAGGGITTEDRNTFLGAFSQAAFSVTNATAIGANAQVTQSNTLILGSIAGNNGATADTRVGIGDSAPQKMLSVRDGMNIDQGNTNNGTVAVSTLTFGSVSGEGIGSKRTAGGSQFGLDFYTAATLRMSITNSGLVSIANLGAAGSTALCQNASNQIATCSSSIRYKDSIATFNRGIDLIRQLHPVTFRWKDGGKSDLGLIAEEVQKVEPLLTSYNAEGEVEGVKYDHLTVALINAMQEQQARLDMEERRANELRNENALLRARLERIEQAIQDLTSKQPMSSSSRTETVQGDLR